MSSGESSRPSSSEGVVSDRPGTASTTSSPAESPQVPFSPNPSSQTPSVRSVSIIDNSGFASITSSPRVQFPAITRVPPQDALSRSAMPRTFSSSSARTFSSNHVREPFSAPASRPPTIYSMTAASALTVKARRLKSTMLNEAVPLIKPWLDQAKDPRAKYAYFTTYGMIVVGFLAACARIFFGYQSVPLMSGKLCMVLNEDFSGGDDAVFGESGTFFREVELSGWGNDEFEMTTSSSNNSYIYNNRLYIFPTLTADDIGEQNVWDGYTFNMTDCTYNITQASDYTCGGSTTPCLLANTTAAANTTSPAPQTQNTTLMEYLNACSSTSNATQGRIIPPVQSARLSTKSSASIKFGKVEVVAKNPKGDWLWPAIWMLPKDNVYGTWPLSGEIDIMESRGNAPSYPFQGSNTVRGSLNWGPSALLNGVSKTYGFWTSRWAPYDAGFHTYTLEWDPKFIRITVDSRLHHLVITKFNEPFFTRGGFPNVVQSQNGTGEVVLENPWVNGTLAAPFDESFYLILNLAVGGTNGWFPDAPTQKASGGKPWLNTAATAMRDFWLAKDMWYPTWSQDPEERAFIVDSVKMWQQC